MKRIKLMIISVLIAAAMSTPAFAKSEFNLVTVAGPDWFGDIEITGSDIPTSLVLGGVFDPQRPLTPPEGLDRGYLITRGYEEDGERVMFDRMLYFPGQPGYVYYLEIINGSGPYDGHWFRVTEGEGELLLSALEKGGVHLPKFESASEASSSAEKGGAPAAQSIRSENPPIETLAQAREQLVGLNVSELPYAIAGLVLVGILVGGFSGWSIRGIRFRKSPA